jgi:ATP-binding protein involved in chromosome partitioning
MRQDIPGGGRFAEVSDAAGGVMQIVYKENVMFQKKQREETACAAGTAVPDRAAKGADDTAALHANMAGIKHKLLVLSGKGGVGKSTVAVNLALALAARGRATGILDIDIHGPSIPKLLGIEGEKLRGTEDGKILPLACNGNLKALSVGFMLGSPDDAVVWRGPLKYGIIKQFLKDAAWGVLDYLVIDSPPGTGDEPLSACQLIENPDGAVIVTTPQDVALIDVRKSITFCRLLNMPVLGVVENMSGFACPHCGQVTDIFKSGGGERMASEMGVPFLGRIPIEPRIAAGADAGSAFYAETVLAGSPARANFTKIVDMLDKGGSQ